MVNGEWYNSEWSMENHIGKGVLLTIYHSQTWLVFSVIGLPQSQFYRLQRVKEKDLPIFISSKYDEETNQ